MEKAGEFNSMKFIVMFFALYPLFSGSAFAKDKLPNADSRCTKDSDCKVVDISCNSCKYFSKWIATNQNYTHKCVTLADPLNCPEMDMILSSTRAVCRKNQCALRSPLEIYNENKTFKQQYANHPLKNGNKLKCPSMAGDFFLAEPKNSRGLTKQKFYFENIKTDKGVSSGLVCLYRIKEMKNSYVEVTVHFQIIGDTPMLDYFCKKKSFASPHLQIKFDKDFAFSTSFNIFEHDGKKILHLTSLEKAFLPTEDSVKEYAIRCN
jgi:hypothetical protein